MKEVDHESIYIAYDSSGSPIGVLMSESQEKAEIAWAGMGAQVHNVEEIDPNNTTGGVHGVIFLLTSTKCNSNADFGHRLGGVDFYQWKRGL